VSKLFGRPAFSRRQISSAPDPDIVVRPGGREGEADHIAW